MNSTPEKNILNHRRETVSESSSGVSSQPSTSSSLQIRPTYPDKSQQYKHLPSLNDTFNLPQSENSYMLMDIIKNNISKSPNAGKNLNEYMVMEPSNENGSKSKVMSINPQTQRGAEYMIKELTKENDEKVTIIKSEPPLAADNWNEFKVVEPANKIDAKVTRNNQHQLLVATNTNEYMVMEPANKSDAKVNNNVSESPLAARNINEYMIMEPANCNEYTIMESAKNYDSKVTRINSKPPPDAEDCNEYMAMEPADKNIHIIPKTEKFKINQGDQYLVMDLGKSHESNACIDYLLMTLTSSADNNNMAKSQTDAVASYPSTSKAADIISSISPCMVVASLPSTIEPLVALISSSEEMLVPQPRIHSSVSQPSLANMSGSSNTSLTSAGSGQPIINSNLYHVKSVPGDINEYMTMDPAEKEQPKFSSYMTMSTSSNTPSKEHWKLNNNVNTLTPQDNEYILIYSPEGNQIPPTTIGSSSSREVLSLDPCKDPTAPQTSTTTSSTYSRTFGAFKLPFTKQLIIPKASSSSGKNVTGILQCSSSYIMFVCQSLIKVNV